MNQPSISCSLPNTILHSFSFVDQKLTQQGCITHLQLISRGINEEEVQNPSQGIRLLVLLRAIVHTIHCSSLLCIIPTVPSLLFNISVHFNCFTSIPSHLLRLHPHYCITAAPSCPLGSLLVSEPCLLHVSYYMCVAIAYCNW